MKWNLLYIDKQNKLFEMCNCTGAFDVHCRCLDGVNLQKCPMRNDTTIWLFENNYEYIRALENANTYRQKGLELHHYITRHLKIRSSIIKKDIIDEYIKRLFNKELDEFISEIRTYNRRINKWVITRVYYIKILKNHWFYKSIKQYFKCNEELIKQKIEDLWNYNQDKFNPEDSSSEESSEESSEDSSSEDSSSEDSSEHEDSSDNK